MLATSPPVVAEAPVAPSEAYAGMARQTVASVLLLTVTLVTTMPSPKLKLVAPLQWVFDPVTSTQICVPC